MLGAQIRTPSLDVAGSTLLVGRGVRPPAVSSQELSRCSFNCEAEAVRGDRQPTAPGTFLNLCVYFLFATLR